MLYNGVIDLRENDIIAGSYKILNRIGSGGTGTVFLGYHLHLQKYVVLKETAIRLKDERLIRTEADILKNLHHPYLPQVYDLLISESSVITVLDYIEGNDLSKYPCGPQNLSEKVLLKWLGQLAEVLDYLHSNEVPVIHSDIKPGNVIVRENGDICLIDFNISMMFNDGNKLLGYSAQYASPEQFYLAQTVASGGTPEYRLDPSSDIYSTGALFYYLMTGIAPNCAAPTLPLKEMGDIGYSSALVNIVDKCMQWQREKRYQNGGELLKAVRYYWKQDDRYKLMLVVKALCILLGVAVLGSGIYAGIRWHENMIRDSYRRDYDTVATKLREGDDQGAEEAGLDILGEEKYESFLMKNPKDYAELLHAIGDINYNREDYESAAEYYGRALETAEKSDTNLSVYYRDYAIALAREGKVEQAREILEKAEMSGVTGSALRLVETTCAFMSGDYVTCIALAEEMEQDPEAERDCIEEAAYFAGLSEKKRNNRLAGIEWFKKASEGGNIVYLKRLADAYWELAGEYGVSQSQKDLYALEACKIYKRLCDEYYPTFENLMNLAITQYFLRDYTECQLTLERCIEKYPEKYSEDYRVSMYLSFLYEDLGQRDRAREEARRALEIINTRTGVLNSQESEAVDRLRSISR